MILIGTQDEQLVNRRLHEPKHEPPFPILDVRRYSYRDKA